MNYQRFGRGKCSADCNNDTFNILTTPQEDKLNFKTIKQLKIMCTKCGHLHQIDMSEELR